jgi:hypothetical protein
VYRVREILKIAKLTKLRAKRTSMEANFKKTPRGGLQNDALTVALGAEEHLM